MSILDRLKGLFGGSGTPHKDILGGSAGRSDTGYSGGYSSAGAAGAASAHRGSDAPDDDEGFRGPRRGDDEFAPGTPDRDDR